MPYGGKPSHGPSIKMVYHHGVPPIRLAEESRLLCGISSGRGCLKKTGVTSSLTGHTGRDIRKRVLPWEIKVGASIRRFIRPDIQHSSYHAEALSDNGQGALKVTLSAIRLAVANGNSPITVISCLSRTTEWIIRRPSNAFWSGWVSPTGLTFTEKLNNPSL